LNYFDEVIKVLLAIVRKILYIYLQIDEECRGGFVSKFGQYLKTFVEANKINVYNLAKQAGLERTAFHKIMAGDRKPTENFVEKLAKALPFTPEERRRLFEYYHISRIGEQKYNSRAQVKELVELLGRIEKEQAAAVESGGTSSPLGSTNLTAKGNFAVNNLIKSAIEESLSLESARKIDFFISSDYRYFWNELLDCYTKNPNAVIRHVVAFSKKNDFTNDKNNNLEQLIAFLPLVFTSFSGYHPHYFYKTSPGIEITNTMPYFIITSSNKLILINQNFDKAVLVCDIDLVDIYKENFEAILAESSNLLKNFDNMFDLVHFYANIGRSSKNSPFHWIEPEPCIGATMEPALVDSLIKANIAHREQFLGAVNRNFESLKLLSQSNINICTTDGLIRLIDTGMIYYADEAFVQPMSKAQLKKLLQQLRGHLQSGKTKLLFNDPSKMTIATKTLIAASEATGVHFVMGVGEQNHPSRFICLTISESSITEAFVDFIESIEDSGLVYSTERSLNAFDNIIDSI